MCFKTGPPGTIGTELEWLVRDCADPSLSVPFSRIQQVCDSLSEPGILPGAGLLTLEPGGQVELSTAPAKDLSACIAVANDDLAVLHEAFGDAGLVLTGRGIDPLRRPNRVLELPRYAAMEEFFDRDGHWGRLMMCSTASVQVCVDAGLDDDGTSGCAFRWRLLHALGPVLVGAFANSPLRRGQPTGWKCTRQLVWSRLDPGRTRSPAGAEPADSEGLGSDAALEHWVRYAMDADVLCVRRPDGEPWTVPAGLTFRDWLRGSGQPRAPEDESGVPPEPPTADDLSYHLSTLFPPVRPRGHLELRMIDAQPGDGWIVPVSVVAALTDDPVAADAAMAAAEPVWQANGASGRASPVPRQRIAGRDQATPWLRAARLGLADPVLARAAQQCFDAAAASLARSAAPAVARSAVTDFAERYVYRNRCPADDILDSIPDLEGQP
ncbi:MAG TPA: ergothioneine biosynthesis glutamate--cysteine ligase EgtA [Streptosporangiaceae bacterium]|nr:ergothioneine biosynthesis glutamate--cysteine ligase EgtA [Streptosporangiaceae bacterium]